MDPRPYSGSRFPVPPSTPFVAVRKIFPFWLVLFFAFWGILEEAEGYFYVRARIFSWGL